MKIAALADIHSNHLALEACLEDIEKVGADALAFLGDYVSDCPYPKITLDILKDVRKRYKTWFVRGNREDYMLDHRKRPGEKWSYCSRSGSLLYTFNELTDGDFDFFEKMPISMVIELEGYPAFSICHGSMTNNRELFVGDSPLTRKVMGEMTTELLLCGHCHVQYVFETDGKRIINAGSVGNPVSGRREASYVLISSHGGRWDAQIRSVPFDTEAVIREFHESGLLEKADVWSRAYIAALREGRNYNFECVKLIRKMCDETGSEFDNEELWQKAAEILGI